MPTKNKASHCDIVRCFLPDYFPVFIPSFTLVFHLPSFFILSPQLPSNLQRTTSPPRSKDKQQPQPSPHTLMGCFLSAIEDDRRGMAQALEFNKTWERNNRGRAVDGYRWTLEDCSRCGFQTSRIAGQRDHDYSHLCDRCEARERKRVERAVGSRR